MSVSHFVNLFVHRILKIINHIRECQQEFLDKKQLLMTKLLLLSILCAIHLHIFIALSRQQLTAAQWD